MVPCTREEGVKRVNHKICVSSLVGADSPQPRFGEPMRVDLSVFVRVLCSNLKTSNRFDL